MTPILRIRLLGEFRLFIDDQPIHTIDKPRQQALLAFLLLHRHAPQSRQQLAFCFWPDSSEAQAYTNLRKLFFQLRQGLPLADTFLSADQQSLGWQDASPISLDIAELEEALNQLAGTTTPEAETIERVVSLYPGELLPTCYDDWILPLRRALHERVVNVLTQAIEGLIAQRAYPVGLRCAEHLLRLDPLHEMTYRHLMQLRALAGDRTGALRVYYECARILEQELGVPPGVQTQTLYEQLLRVEPQPAAPVPVQVPNRVPLVGRQREWNRLQQAWRAARHGPHVVTIWGEAGMGKTRLAEELLRWARPQAGAVAYARAYAAEGALTYAPVAAWLRSEALRPALANLDEFWLVEIGRLLPELLAKRPHLPPPAPLTEGWQRQRFYEALALALLAAPQPRLLVLDDLQWCDQETLAWLHYLVRFDPQAPLLVLGTVRSEEVDEQHPLQELLRYLRREGQCSEIELAPLNAEETAQLVAHLAGEDAAVAAAHLYRETEGNPLFIVELVRAGLVAELAMAEGQGKSLPPTVQAVIAARLAQLSPFARQLAQLAATVGRAFTIDVLIAAASDISEDALVQGLDELWQRRIVREQSKQDYDFSHDKIRDGVYAQLTPARRKLLHRHVAQALERLYATNLDEVSGQVAGHFEQAGLGERAISYYQRAAQVAQRLHANQEALRYYQQALALAQREEAYQGILAQRAKVYLDLYQGKEAAGDFQQLLDRARQAGNREQELGFLLGLVNAYYLVALDDQATDAALRLRELYATTQILACKLGNKRNRVLSLLLPIWHFWPELRDQAIADAQEAFALSDELGDEELMLDSKLALLYNAHEQEQAEVGDGLLKELQARHDLDRLNRAQFYLMWTHYLLGNFDRAVSLCDAGIELAARLGVPPVQYPTLKAFALLGLGQYEDAWAALQQEIADDDHRLGHTFKETGIGMYLFEVGAYGQAAAVFEQVVVQAERLRRGWLREWARLGFVRSLLRARQGGQTDWTRAAQALAAADQNVLQGLKPWQAQALALQAEIALAAGRQEEALRQTHEAIALMVANGFQANLAAALELQARLLLQLDRPGEALARLDEALAITTAIGYRSLVWRIHATKAQTLEELGQREAAAPEWQRAAEIIQRLALTISDPELQQGFMSEPLIASIVTHTQNQHANQRGR